jgi:hypothetical protein
VRKMSGGCLCGKVRYFANADASMVLCATVRTAKSRRERLSRLWWPFPNRGSLLKGRLKRITTEVTAAASRS